MLGKIYTINIECNKINKTLDFVTRVFKIYNTKILSKQREN